MLLSYPLKRSENSSLLSSSSDLKTLPPLLSVLVMCYTTYSGDGVRVKAPPLKEEEGV